MEFVRDLPEEVTSKETFEKELRNVLKNNLYIEYYALSIVPMRSRGRQISLTNTILSPHRIRNGNQRAHERDADELFEEIGDVIWAGDTQKIVQDLVDGYTVKDITTRHSIPRRTVYYLLEKLEAACVEAGVINAV